MSSKLKDALASGHRANARAEAEKVAKALAAEQAARAAQASNFIFWMEHVFDEESEHYVYRKIEKAVAAGEKEVRYQHNDPQLARALETDGALRATHWEKYDYLNDDEIKETYGGVVVTWEDK